MRKVDLRMNEQFKYVVIKKLVDSNGNKKNAAIKLNCSLRTVNRLIIKYKMEGKLGFVHKNRGRKPATAFTDDIKAKVIDLYITKYFGANLAHFSQLLNKHEGILISDSTLNHWLRDVDILSPKARRKTKRRLEADLRNRKKASSSLKQKAVIEDKLELLNRSDVHENQKERLQYLAAGTAGTTDPQKKTGYGAIIDKAARIVNAYPAALF